MTAVENREQWLVPQARGRRRNNSADCSPPLSNDLPSTNFSERIHRNFREDTCQVLFGYRPR